MIAEMPFVFGPYDQGFYDMDRLPHDPRNLRELVETDLRRGARLIIKIQDEIDPQIRIATARNVTLENIHTSGHASIVDLKWLAAAIAPKSLVPIHTFEGDSFSKLFGNVTRRTDGEWWKV